MSSHSAPFLVVPSRRGSVPNLTPDQARAILLPDERFLSVSVLEAQEFLKPCAASKMAMAQLCGLPEFHVVLSIRNSFQGMHASAPSSDKQIAGDHEKGRVTVSLSQWKATVESLRPDVAVVMHESSALAEPPSRKRRTAQSRTETWLEQARQSFPPSSPGAATIVAPYLNRSDADGAVIVDALPRNENLLEYAASLRAVTDGERVPALCVATSLPAYLAALSAGIQWIECPVAWDLAASGIALTLDLYGGDEARRTTAAASEPQIDLNDAAFALDIGPLAEHCKCFTCQRHCRAYLHHLLTVQEMNSEILLTIHNLTQLVMLCRLCRTRPSTETQRLLQRIADQL